jgi:D-beta-D-heptose 7-phosphate kinase/D-beta-D-heptose 1-phosphate adenosyltransferase
MIDRLAEVMLDKYIWGEVQRISPEAPIPLVRAMHQSHQPGGAANVAMNLARLGAKATLIGFAGGDENEMRLCECLQKEGIPAELVYSEGYPTITKLRVVGGSQQMLRIDTERLDPRPGDEYRRLIDRARKHLPECDLVVLSDYCKGALTSEVCRAVIEEARRLGIPVVIDPKSADFSGYRGATAICPNMAELSAATGLETDDLTALLAAAERLIPQLELEFLIATLGERGIALVREGKRFLAPALAREVFDVSGAGDTVIAVVALCLASGVAPEAAVQLANLAAGVVVGKVGTVPIEKHELLGALSPEVALHAANKVLKRDQLLGCMAQWRANGERIVFTNGCFDLLHVGHIALLEQSRRFGDRLIVAINSDDSVRALKGAGRPIVRQEDRARVLAALTAVDAVTIFDDSTPLSLVLATRPDVIVKGGDYGVEDVVGAREVQSWGGQVKIVPSLPGSSTTRLIERGSRREADAVPGD